MATVLDSAGCISVYPGAPAFFVLRDPNGLLRDPTNAASSGLTPTGAYDDTKPYKWHPDPATSNPPLPTGVISNDGYKMIVKMICDGALHARFLDDPCPDGGNITVTLVDNNNQPVPVAPLTANYTNDPAVSTFPKGKTKK